MGHKQQQQVQKSTVLFAACHYYFYLLLSLLFILTFHFAATQKHKRDKIKEAEINNNKKKTKIMKNSNEKAVKGINE